MSVVNQIKAGGTTYNLASTAYATCDTAAATQAKVATLAGFTLITGVTVHVKFTNSNTASAPTLNVNSTGAKNIVKYGTTGAGTSATASWYAGAVVSFTYDGTSWIINNYKEDTNTTYSSLKNPNALTLQLNGTTSKTYDGSSAQTFNVTASSIGAAASSHNHDSTYLKLSGGTMTGDIAFSATGTTGTSSKITFSGSTDTAAIYYNVPTSDQGNLVFDMGDDTNAYIQFAESGTVGSYISPSDGTYHGNATSATIASTVKDAGDGRTLSFNYSAVGMSSTSWLGSWDGNTLKAISPSNVTAGSATKLATARTVRTNLASTSTASFDGSANITPGVTGTLPIANGGTGNTIGQAETLKKVSVSGNNTNNYPFHRFAYVTGVTGQYSDTDSIFLIRQMYDGGYFGIVKVSMRTNGSNSAVSVTARWLVRYGWAVDAVQFGRYGVTGNSCYADIFLKTPGAYPRTEVVRLSSGTSGWTMCDSNETSSTTTSDRGSSTNCYSSISDAATQLHSGTAYTATGSSIDSGIANSANSLSGTLSVSHGGTGATTLASGTVLIGNGTGAIQTRNIMNNQTQTNMGWTPSNGSYLTTANTLAYWNGAYTGTRSNLVYCKNGEIATTDIVVVSSTQPSASTCKIWIKP